MEHKNGTTRRRYKDSSIRGQREKPLWQTTLEPLADPSKRPRSDFDLTRPVPETARKITEALIKAIAAEDDQTVAELYDVMGDLIATRSRRPYRSVMVVQRGLRVVSIRGCAGLRVLVKRYHETGRYKDEDGHFDLQAWRKRGA